MINIAVVGTGVMGKNHVRIYSQMSNVNLVAICDINEKTGKKVAKSYNTKFYKNYNNLIKQEKIDGVSIAVPTSLHKITSVEFIKNRIPVLIEKPLAETVKEAQVIINMARKKNVLLFVGHVERFNPAVKQLSKLVRKGEFGNILSIVAKRVGLYDPKIKDVNVVTDLAVHDLDIISSIVGKKPLSIYAKGSGELINGLEDHAEIFLDYGYFGCFIQVNWLTPIKIRNLSITGTHGYAELNYVTQKLEVYKSQAALNAHKEFKDFVTRFGNPKRKEFNLEKAEPLKLELENFVNSIIGTEKPMVNALDGLIAVELSELVIESIRNKKIIKLSK